MAFLILFEEGLRNLREAQLVSQGAVDNWVPMGGDIVEISAARKSSPDKRKLEGLDLGMQELRTYFRLFMLSTVLLMFMFCSRISKNRNRETGNIFDSWKPIKRNRLKFAVQFEFRIWLWQEWSPFVASDEQSAWTIRTLEEIYAVYRLEIHRFGRRHGWQSSEWHCAVYV